jgi:ferredoxin-NADP reductase
VAVPNTGPRRLRITGSRALTHDTRLVEISLADGSPVGFRGGQYLIVNTGVVLPDGKAVKRAYSLLSSDARQDRAQIAVLRLDAGPGSRALHDAPAGTELSFSGPWGKMYPEAGSGGRSLILATDTGITAALGLATSQGFAPLAAEADLVWYVTSDTYFVTMVHVRAYLGACPVRFSVAPALPVGHPERLHHARAAIERVLAGRVPGQLYAAGDGALVHPIRDELVQRGVPDASARLEAFFNNPARKAAG